MLQLWRGIVWFVSTRFKAYVYVQWCPATKISKLHIRDVMIHSLSVSIYHLFCIMIQQHTAWYSMAEFCRWTEPSFQNHNALYLPQLQNCKAGIKLQHQLSYSTHILWSIKVKTWRIYITHDNRYVPIFDVWIQLNLYQYCITGLMYHGMVIYWHTVASLLCIKHELRCIQYSILIQVDACINLVTHANY